MSWYGHPEWEYGYRAMNDYVAEIAVYGEDAMVRGSGYCAGTCVTVVRVADGLVVREWITDHRIDVAIDRAEAIMRGTADVAQWSRNDYVAAGLLGGK